MKYNYTQSFFGQKKEVSPGKWYIRVQAGFRPDGKQRRKRKTVYGTELDADAAIRKLADEMGATLSIGDNVTLSTYFYTVFLPGREATTTNANAKTYASVFKNHIAPAFGGRHIDTIRNTDIQRWINKLPPQSAQAYVRALRAILNQAAFDHVISESPMERYSFRMPKGRRSKPLPVWGAKEVMYALEHLRKSDIYSLWLVMVGAGLSKSEALALDWEGIRFVSVVSGGTEKVNAVFSVENAVTAEDGTKEPKNDRRLRQCTLSPLFAGHLRDCKSVGPICANSKGKRMHPSTVAHKWKALFDDGGELYGMPYVTINRMRATYSTLMQSAGIDSTLINAMQGRAENSSVLYSNYLNPPIASFIAAGNQLERAVLS